MDVRYEHLYVLHHVLYIKAEPKCHHYKQFENEIKWCALENISWKYWLTSDGNAHNTIYILLYFYPGYKMQSKNMAWLPPKGESRNDSLKCIIQFTT